MPVRAPASSSFDWYRVNVRHAASVAPLRRLPEKGPLSAPPPMIQRRSLMARNVPVPVPVSGKKTPGEPGHTLPVQIRTEVCQGSLYRTQSNGDKFAPKTRDRVRWWCGGWGGMVVRFALCDPCARVSREPCVPRLPPGLFTGTKERSHMIAHTATAFSTGWRSV